MKRADSLKKNAQFQYVYRRGKGISDAVLTLIHVKNRQTRVGFVISRKIGKAVLRNRIKRRLRACFTPLLPSLEKGYYVVVVRKNAADAAYRDLEHSVLSLLRRRKLIRDSVPAASGQGLPAETEDRNRIGGSRELQNGPVAGPRTEVSGG